MSCYGIINLFLLSIALFMPWRNGFSQQDFVNQQDYSLYIISNTPPQKNFYTISLKTPSSFETFQLLS